MSNGPIGTGWKTERDSQILAMFTAGYSYKQIGEKFGISRQRAQQIVRPPIQVIVSLRKRAGDKCERCGIPLQTGFHVHHTDTTINGTYADLSKVRLLCKSCHKAEDWMLAKLGKQNSCMTDTPKKYMIAVSVTPHTRQEFIRRAKALGVSTSKLLRTIVERYLMEQR